MKRYFYKWYRRTYRFGNRMEARFTYAGIFIAVSSLAAMIFGLNTDKTMLYQIFSVLFCVIIIAFVFSIRFRPVLTVSRNLPEYCRSGEKLHYTITIENKGLREKGLFYREIPEDPMPSAEEFLNTPEPQEGARNRFDQKMGYYRWTWLIQKRQGAVFEDIAIPDIAANEKKNINVELLPERRGILRLEGVRIYKTDPFGLVKSNIRFKLPDTITVLPKLYLFPNLAMPGSQKLNESGVTEAMKVGNSEEFMSLREYRPGDPLKNIHWKAFAKKGEPVIKEFHDEFFARSALVLDTFIAAAYSDILEEAVSVAASAVLEIQSGDMLVDLMFVGSKSFCFTAGRGVSSTTSLLEILASVQPCREKSFAVLSGMVKERSQLLGGCFIVFTSIDKDRAELIKFLELSGIESRAVLVTGSVETSAAALAAFGLADKVRILELGKIQEGLLTL